MNKPMSIKEKLAMEAAQQGQVGAVQPGDGVNPPVPGRTVAAFPAPAVPGPPPPPPAPRGLVANMTGSGAPLPPQVQTTIAPPPIQTMPLASPVETALQNVPADSMLEERLALVCALIRATAGNITPAKAASEADKYLKALIV